LPSHLIPGLRRPLWGVWNLYGGIFTNIVAEHRKLGRQMAPFVELSPFVAQSNMRG
jgi:hypothetical protein